MSTNDYSIWTDEQLQAQLDEWKPLIDGGIKLDIELISIPNAYPQCFVDPLVYLLRFEQQRFRLSESQAYLVSDWIVDCTLLFQKTQSLAETVDYTQPMAIYPEMPVAGEA